MAMTDFLFTSESVTEGHPDKVADQVSDAILDAIIAEDPSGRVACECLVTTGLALIAGEITTECYVDMPGIVRATIKEIGYNDSAMGFDWETCAILTSIDQQSPDIARGVNGEEQGAGDQGLMVGYACTETPELMPMPIAFAHKLTKRLADVRKANILDFLRPDGKSQVTVQYVDNKPVRVDAVVIAAQHTADVKNEVLQEGLIEEVIKHVIPEGLMDKDKILRQHNGEVRNWRAVSGLWGDGPQDHRRYLWRTGQSRRGCLLRQGPLQGRPQQLLHGPARCKKRRSCWSSGQV